MKHKKFVLFGDGYVAQYHKAAICALGGDILNIFDPVAYGGWLYYVDPRSYLEMADYVVICSPTWLHREQIVGALDLAPQAQIIVEKPMILPGQDWIDDDRVNIVMQYRWASIHKPIGRFRVRFIRNQDYWNSWKGNSEKTGGVVFNLFIHYIDLAYLYMAEFEGDIRSSGKGYRMADDIDLTAFSPEMLYRHMYESIDQGFGVKPGHVKPIWDYMWRRQKDLGTSEESDVRNGKPFYFFHI